MKSENSALLQKLQRCETKSTQEVDRKNKELDRMSLEMKKMTAVIASLKQKQRQMELQTTPNASKSPFPNSRVSQSIDFAVGGRQFMSPGQQQQQTGRHPLQDS